MNPLWEADRSDELLSLLQKARRLFRENGLPLTAINEAISLLIGYDTKSMELADGLPTTADLDAIAEEERIKEATNAKTATTR